MLDMKTMGKTFQFKVESTRDRSTYKMTFCSNCGNGLAWRIAGVDLVVMSSSDERAPHTQLPMRPVTFEEDLDGQDEEKVSPQVFTSRISSRILRDPMKTVGFLVHRFSIVKSFQYQMRDSLFALQLWSSAVNKDRTDVRFQVGDNGRIFPAHTALLVARCPALEALCRDRQSSPYSSPMIVPISTTDPDVFEEFLYFLYTGTLKTPSSRLDERLSEVADRFRVETLNLLTRETPSAAGFQQRLDQSQISDIFKSLT